MRVEIVEQLPKRNWASREVSAEAPASRALQSFFITVNSEDSLFSVESPGSGPVAKTEGSGGAFSGDFLITFRSAKDARHKAKHFALLDKLTALFRNVGSPATLAVTLCLANRRARDQRKNRLEVRLRLEAIGDSAEQAEMRWGLGLAQVQQALLFTSRGLRQQNSSATP